jgi:hypothetical protein
MSKYQDWDPTLILEDNDKNHIANFAVDMKKYVNDTIYRTINSGKCSNFEVDVGYSETLDINGTAELGVENGKYKIRVTFGAIKKLIEIFSSEKFITIYNAISNKNIMLDKKSVIDVSLYFCILQMFMHEFAHVFRGHLRHKSEIQKHKGNGLFMSETNHDVDCINDDAIFAMECDADFVSGMIIGTELKTQIKGLIKDINVSENLAMRDLTSLVAMSMQVFFTIMRDNGINTAHYPDPLVRSIHVISTAAGEVGAIHGNEAVLFLTTGALQAELNAHLFSKNMLRDSEMISRQIDKVSKSTEWYESIWRKYSPCLA